MRSRQHMSRKERKQKIKSEKMLLKKNKKESKKQLEKVAAKGVKKGKKAVKVSGITADTKQKVNGKKMGVHIGKKVKAVMPQ